MLFYEYAPVFFLFCFDDLLIIGYYTVLLQNVYTAQFYLKILKRLVYSQLSNVIITEYPYVVVLIFSDCKIESAVYLDNIF